MSVQAGPVGSYHKNVWIEVTPRQNNRLRTILEPKHKSTHSNIPWKICLGPTCLDELEPGPDAGGLDGMLLLVGGEVYLRGEG